MRHVWNTAHGRCVTILGLVIALWGSGQPRSASAAERPPVWRVLILFDSDPFNPAALTAVEALRAAMVDGAAPRLVTFRTEMLDAVGLEAVDQEAEFLALLKKKRYAGHLDIVITTGGPALQFAKRYREVLWPGVPLVALGMSEAPLRAETNGLDTTGVPFVLDEEGTLALARQLQPDAERLVLVAGGSAFDREEWPRLQLAARRGGRGLEIETLFGKPLKVVLDRVSKLPRQSIVIYSTVSVDADGQVLTPAVVATQLAAASAAPTYGIWESQIGRGIVGGSVEGLVAHGQRAAALALRVLRRTGPGVKTDLPPASAVPTVDWRQMERFGLPENRLPPGSVVLFRPPSFLREHWGAIAAVSAVMVSQTALIIALLAQARHRRRAEADAAKQRADLAHAARLSAVGELTASIAHEINQPLGAILSNAEAAELFLDADPPRVDRVRGILADIRHEDQRAGAVIRELRGLARKQPPAQMPVSMNDVVTALLPLLGADARRRGAAVEVDLESRLPHVLGDRTQLEQMVLNLVLNALDAVAPPWEGTRGVRIQTRQHNGRVEVTIADTGPGLAPGDNDRIFDSFYTTKPTGLGLGLTIVRSIVEAHGGQVSPERTPGGWTVFRVGLPVVKHEPGKRESARIH